MWTPSSRAHSFLLWPNNKRCFSMVTYESTSVLRVFKGRFTDFTGSIHEEARLQRDNGHAPQIT